MKWSIHWWSLLSDEWYIKKNLNENISFEISLGALKIIKWRE